MKTDIQILKAHIKDLKYDIKRWTEKLRIIKLTGKKGRYCTVKDYTKWLAQANDQLAEAEVKLKILKDGGTIVETVEKDSNCLPIVVAFLVLLGGILLLAHCVC